MQSTLGWKCWCLRKHNWCMYYQMLSSQPTFSYQANSFVLQGSWYSYKEPSSPKSWHVTSSLSYDYSNLTSHFFLQWYLPNLLNNCLIRILKPRIIDVSFEFPGNEEAWCFCRIGIEGSMSQTDFGFGFKLNLQPWRMHIANDSK